MLLPKAPVRRRIRASQVCNRCKRRKIKCDKNKPCSTCVKMKTPCSYDSQWAPGADSNSGNPATSGKGLAASHSNGSVSGSQIESAAEDSGQPKFKNAWSSSAIDEMILMPKKAYEDLLPLLLQIPQNQSLEVIVAPVMLGDTGQAGLNSNIGVIRTSLHDLKFPGVLQSASTNNLEFEPHIVKLVKNDFVGVNPFHDRNELLTLQVPFTRSDPLTGKWWQHHGVFSWKTIQIKDVWLSQILEYTARKTATDSTGAFRSQSPTNGKGSEGPIADYQSESSNYGSADLLGGANILGLVLYNGNIKVDLKALDQMKLVLPNKRVVWTLVKRYFLVLYAFCPALDERDFREAISSVIGAESYEETEVVVNISNKIDYINLAILLMVLRFSFVSLFSNRESVNEAIVRSDDPIYSELKYLLTHPIDINVVEICSSCLHQFLYLQDVTIPLFLLVLLLRAYRYLAPEVGFREDGEDSQRFSGLLINIGYSLGLNRDPSNFPGQLDARKSNFVRKAWTFVCITDIMEGYQYGKAISNNINFFDTAYPTVEEGAENIYDKDLDRAVTMLLNIGDCLIEGDMKQMVDLCLNVRKPIHLSYFTSLLNVIEAGTIARFGNLKDYLQPLESYNPAYTCGKFMKATILVTMRIFIVTLLAHLAEYYKAKHNSQLFYYYTKKSLCVISDEIMAMMPSFVTKPDELFGDGVCVLINPFIIDAVFRANEIFISNILRCNNYLYFRSNSKDHELRMANDPDYFTHFQKVSDLVMLLQKFCKLCVVIESVLSTRYYMAWKVLKSHQKLLSAMAEPEFYELAGIDPELSPTEGPHNFTSSQLQELIDMLRKSFAFVENQVSENSHELSAEKIWGNSTKAKVPVFINEYTSHQQRSTSSESALGTGSTHFNDVTNAEYESSTTIATPDGQLGNSDMSRIPDWQFIGFDDVNAFNNDEVDVLWQQMSSQKLQKYEQLERAAWQGFFEV